MSDHAVPVDGQRDATPESSTPNYAGVRTGILQAGERVTLTDPKGRRHSMILTPGKVFHTTKGGINHDDLIGGPEGVVVTSAAGMQFLAMRPLMNDFMVSMPREAAVIYPKDAAQIIMWTDIFPGARVLEAGVGSGALSIAMLRAIGPDGKLFSFERREDFAKVAAKNVETFIQGQHPGWTLRVGDLVTSLREGAMADQQVDRVVLDMLAPWECIDDVAEVMVPGGVLCCYVATATQLGRTMDTLRAHGGFTEPAATENSIREWHAEGLAIRPGHGTSGHTGFLIHTRRLAPGVTAPMRKRRPAPGAYGPDYNGPRPANVTAEHLRHGVPAEPAPAAEAAPVQNGAAENPPKNPPRTDMDESAELLNRRLTEARNDARQLAQTNDRLNQTLKEARSHLVSLKAQLDAMTEPPLGRGRVVAVLDSLVDVAVQGRVLRVGLAPEWEGTGGLETGDLVLLNESQVVVGVLDPNAPSGAEELATVIEVDEATAVVGNGQDEVRLLLAPGLLSEPPTAAETVVVDRAAGLVLKVVARQHVQELVLDETPDVSYDDIGGLGEQIDRIRDAVELPFLHPELYRSYQLKPPKGVLLYGPPGCGKTMIAKAVAKSLAEQLTDGSAQGSSFITVKGPELLNKFVGETERQIRLVFERAREQATAGIPVVVFFDEMDSLFRTRGTGVSSDVESTIVPQLLAEIDGVEGLDNVIVIGASNREDMIDPAILRPGRLDVKIKLDRPSRAGATDILGKYLTSDLPLHPDDLAAHDGAVDETTQALIDATVASIYDQTAENEFIRVTYASGDTEVLHFSDFASGAMLRNVVDRAKKYAIKAELAGQGGGVSSAGLVAACREEFVENEDLPNTTNPDDWARISGRKGERIVFIQSLVSQHAHRVDPTPSTD